MNVTFVLVTILGGLLLSVHYLGGPETFRAKTTWSREFLYQRPANTESYSKIDGPASSQRVVPAPKPTLIAQEKDNPNNRKTPTQVNHPFVAPPPGAANNGMPFVPATTSNPSSAGSQQAATRGASGSSQASGAGVPSGKTGPSAPATSGPTNRGTQTPAAPSRIGNDGKQESKPTKESVKPGQRQMTNAQKLARIDGLRRAQENVAAKAARNFNGAPGGATRTFNSNRAGSFGAAGNGFGGRH